MKAFSPSVSAQEQAAASADAHAQVRERVKLFLFAVAWADSILAIQRCSAEAGEDFARALPGWRLHNSPALAIQRYELQME